MSRRPRRNHMGFKAKVALAAIKAIEHWPSWRGSLTSTPIRSRRGKHSSRKGQPMCSVRRRQRRRAVGHRREVAPCQDRRADAGKRFFGRSARQSRFVERKAMINREHDLPITKQAQVLRISRGSVYYLTRPMPEADLAIMRRLDRLHLEFPFAGSRMLQGLLVAEVSRDNLDENGGGNRSLKRRPVAKS
jgi:putative transposase